MMPTVEIASEIILEEDNEQLTLEK
jgi:hypothetical protein